MTNKNHEPSGPQFERATGRADRFLAKPAVAADVAAGRAARAEMNRAYAMNIAMIRKAADLTQAELAGRLGTDQGSVSRLESRQDMLLSNAGELPARHRRRGRVDRRHRARVRICPRPHQPGRLTSSRGPCEKRRVLAVPAWAHGDARVTMRETR